MKAKVQAEVEGIRNDAKLVRLNLNLNLNLNLGVS
jgi:hypothetical protein